MHVLTDLPANTRVYLTSNCPAFREPSLRRKLTCQAATCVAHNLSLCLVSGQNDRQCQGGAPRFPRRWLGITLALQMQQHSNPPPLSHQNIFPLPGIQHSPQRAAPDCGEELDPHCLLVGCGSAAALRRSASVPILSHPCMRAAPNVSVMLVPFALQARSRCPKHAYQLPHPSFLPLASLLRRPTRDDDPD